MTGNDRVPRFYVRAWVFKLAQLLLEVQLLRGRRFYSTRRDQWEFLRCIAAFGSLIVCSILPRNLQTVDYMEIHESPHLALAVHGSNESVGNILDADDTERLLISAKSLDLGTVYPDT
ncbi:uncharacterized protein BJX67DRAFT_355047, partial [Aspergillus lucknowensis]